MVLKLRYGAPDGWERAKCKNIEVNQGYDPFFDEEEEAMDFCNGEFDNSPCPIRNECLLYALTNNERYGVWGGMSEIGRKAIRKRYPLQGKQPRGEWEWQSQADALEGINLKDLLEEDDEEE